MKKGHMVSGGFLKRILPVLLSLSISPWFLSTGSLASASSIKQQPAASHCPTVPANFDFMHASRQQLHQYLLPSRPPSGDPQEVDEWLRTVEGVAHSVCVPDTQPQPDLVNGKPVIFSPSCSALPPQTVCNPNWNGYVAGNGIQPGYNDVIGKWTIPCVSSNSAAYQMGNWVGLGGFYNSEDLWQVGSAWDNSHSYHLFYEAVGANGTPMAMTIHSAQCGDQIRAEVWFAPNNPTSNVGYTITDNGTLYRGYAPSGFQSGQLSAEWIDERPGCGNGNFYSLATYTSTAWTNAWASPNNPTAGFYPIGYFFYTRVWIADITRTSTLLLAYNDALGSGGDNYLTHQQFNGNDYC